MPLDVKAVHRDDFGMTVPNKSVLPMLIYNRSGTVAILYAMELGSSDEGHAVTLLPMGSTKAGEVTPRLNLEYWLPFNGTLTLKNVGPSK